MKQLIKVPITALLASLSRGILEKYKPLIIMVTGSVGKTSTKDAIAAALSNEYYLRASEKSYNSEFGVPLTVIGSKNPWESPSAWLKVVGDALLLLMFPAHYPKLLVLEVGADRPGDLDKILKVATPDVVVVTRLPEVPVHVEAYASPQAVRDEEFTPAYALAAGAPLILSSDDEYANAMATRLSAQITTFGMKEGATVHIENPELVVVEGKPQGMRAAVTISGEKHMLVVQGAIGKAQMFAPAAAIATATALGLTPQQALKGLESYVSPPGRARIFEGKNGSILIDDSYNASPAAVEEGLSALALLPAKRRIAVLGDMLELGRYSAEQHERIGEIAAKCVDMIVSVGPRARHITEAACAGNFDETRCMHFDTSVEASAHLAELVREGDVLLIKGSQSIRVERIVEALLADPQDMSKLVRQEKEWKKK